MCLGGRDHGREWLVGRSCKKAGGTSTPSTDPYEQLTMTIKESIESELEAKVNRNVQENMTMLLKKLEEAKPGMKLDVDIQATVSRDGDDNGTPMTAGETS
uniref:Uncharacterized protein n=1 Tax=Daucus carota subsp. sativus TaxID=79200 RepID=A0A164XN23_DAUCS